MPSIEWRYVTGPPGDDPRKAVLGGSAPETWTTDYVTGHMKNVSEHTHRTVSVIEHPDGVGLVAIATSGSWLMWVAVVVK